MQNIFSSRAEHSEFTKYTLNYLQLKKKKNNKKKT